MHTSIYGHISKMKYESAEFLPERRQKAPLSVWCICWETSADPAEPSGVSSVCFHRLRDRRGNKTHVWFREKPEGGMQIRTHEAENEPSKISVSAC